jgi:hypothetical protein
MKPRKSLIWKIPKEDLQEIVKNSTSISEILSHFNLENKGHNYRTLKSRLLEDDISYDNIKLGLSSNRGRKFPNSKKIPLDEILVEDNQYNRRLLKKRLIDQGLIKNQCYICGQLPEWNNKPLVLQLDHINGVSTDNRLNNLRILCPHCHSQTENFAGKNKRTTQLKA